MSELEDRIIKLPKLKLREKKTSMKKMTSVTCGTRSHDLAWVIGVLEGEKRMDRKNFWRNNEMNFPIFGDILTDLGKSGKPKMDKYKRNYIQALHSQTVKNQR